MDPDPHRDPYQNVTDPLHALRGSGSDPNSLESLDTISWPSKRGRNLNFFVFASSKIFVFVHKKPGCYSAKKLELGYFLKDELTS